MKNKTPFTIFGTGGAIRQFIYSEDLAQIIVKLLLEKKDFFGSVIISPNEEYSIKDVAELIATAFGIEKDSIVYDRTYSDGQARKTASNQKLREIFGNEELTFIDFQEGLKRSVEWFKQNYDSARK